MDQIVRMQAEICKTFSNPKRLQIIKLLCKEERNAGDLISETGVSKANLSQHMSLLTAKGVVVARKQGKNVYYRLSDPNINKACSIMHEVVVNNLKKNTKALKRAT